MSNMQLKEQVYVQCNKLLALKRERAKNMIAAAEASRNNETKSSAGDKFETGRAMMQMERDKAELQLNQVEELQAILSRIDLKNICTSVQTGSVVITNEANYFISIPIGKVNMDQKLFYAISLHSPLGKAINGKTKGNQIIFQDRTIQILDVV